MIVRRYSPQDYAQLCSWWTARNLPTIPEIMLSPYGFMSEEDGKNLFCSFVYPTPSAMFYIETAVGDPNIPWEKRADAFNQSVEAACEWSKNNGAKVISTIIEKKTFRRKTFKFKFY